MLKYQLAVVERQRKGIVEDGEQQWSFSGAFLYSLTVITTIGKNPIFFCHFQKCPVNKSVAIVHKAYGSKCMKPI